MATALLMLPLGERLEQRVPWGDRFVVSLLAPVMRSERGARRVEKADVVVLCAPDDLEAFFTAPGKDLPAGAPRSFLEWWTGPESILVLDGDAHRHERRLLVHLLSAGRLALYDELASGAAQSFLEGLDPAGTISLGQLVDELVLRASVRLMFGHERAAALDCVRAYLRDTVDAPVWALPTLLLPGLRSAGVRPASFARADTAAVAFRALVAQEARRKCPAETPNFLDHLLELEARDEPGAGGSSVDAHHYARAVTLVGGLDTLSPALRWCCLHLVREPAVLRKAMDEARASRGTPSATELPYVEAVCKEALRLHPPVLVALRRATRDVVLAGIAVPSGTYVAAGIMLAHRRAATYPDGERFRPERFLQRSFSPWEYLPFGGGARVCLGHALAVRQMVLAVVTILRAIDCEPLPPYGLAARRRSIMVTPVDPIRVKYRRL